MGTDNFNEGRKYRARLWIRQQYASTVSQYSSLMYVTMRATYETEFQQHRSACFHRFNETTTRWYGTAVYRKEYFTSKPWAPWRKYSRHEIPKSRGNKLVTASGCIFFQRVPKRSIPRCTETTGAVLSARKLPFVAEMGRLLKRLFEITA